MKSVFLSLIAALSVLIPHSGMANTEVLPPYFSGAKPIGHGRLTYMFWDIYDATLYAPQGKWSENKPFALKLTYLVDVKGKKIAAFSIDEIKKQGFQDSQKLVLWEKEMTKIFPDMGSGTSIIGIRTKAGNTVFYKDNRHIGSITDSLFTQKFFDIWLSPKTSKPALRENLLGQK